MKRKKSDFGVYFKRHYILYLMLILPILYYIIFCYGPMSGILMAFQRYNLKKGIFGSEWVGFDVFEKIFKNSMFWKSLRNTIVLNILHLFLGFPAPIILAIFLNEIRHARFKKTLQTILYLPHFLSWVIIGGMAIQILATNGGLVNQLLDKVGLPKIPFLTTEVSWMFSYVGINIWQGIGWGAIIYLAAIAGIDQEQYEAARVDGCSRFKMTYMITVPNIAPTVVLMLILRMGGMVNSGLEGPMMLRNAMVNDVATVISIYTYDVGMKSLQYSQATAIGLFQSVVNFILLMVTNKISDKISGHAIW